MPVILMICGEPGASSVSVTLAVCTPTDRGVKVNTIVQEPLAAIAGAAGWVGECEFICVGSSQYSTCEVQRGCPPHSSP